MPYTFTISDVISLGRSRTKKYFWTIMLLGGIAYLPNLLWSTINTYLSPIDDNTAIMTPFEQGEKVGFATGMMIIPTILGIRLFIGLTKSFIMIVEDRKPTTGDLFVPGKYILRYLALKIITYPLILIWLFFFVVPWIYISIRLILVNFYIAEWYTAIDSIKASRYTTKWNEWKLLWFWFVAMGTIILGFLALVLGLLHAIPVVAIAYSAIYLTLKKNLPPDIQPITIDTKTISSIEAQMMNA